MKTTNFTIGIVACYLATILFHVSQGQNNCVESEDDPNCNECTWEVWMCGGVKNYDPTYCVGVIGETGNNSIGCSLPTAICMQEDLRSNGTILNWDNACGRNRSCTQEDFDKYIESELNYVHICESRSGFNETKCCREPCLDLDCFCPTSSKYEYPDTTYSCEEIGTVAPTENYTVIRANITNTFCFRQCLHCYSEECCRDDNCRPYLYLGPGEEPCCDIGSYDGPIVDGQQFSCAEALNNFFLHYILNLL